MKTTIAWGLTLAGLAGCLPGSTLGGQTTFSSGNTGAVGNGMFTVPDLFGLSKDEALAQLRRAGFQGSVADDSSLCGSLVEGRVIELGQVCYQHPPPGRVQGARLPISLRVQTENPWRGNIGTPTEWRLMPKLVGMPLEQARAEMRRVGFTRDERIYLEWIDRPGCAPLTVCETYPTAMSRVGLESTKRISVARDPNAPPERADSIDAPTPDPAPDAPDTSPRTEEPKAEPTPEPFF